MINIFPKLISLLGIAEHINKYNGTTLDEKWIWALLKATSSKPLYEVNAHNHKQVSLG